VFAEFLGRDREILTRIAAGLQFMLNFVAGVEDLDVDGIFGPRTEAAVRGFQQNENLSVDGIVGRQTWTALLRRWLLFSQPG
jgi:peptidoglycan hydrolase-like protein with peptidoglycan-binding domain